MNARQLTGYQAFKFDPDLFRIADNSFGMHCSFDQVPQQSSPAKAIE
jgi:hypothetical protein